MKLKRGLSDEMILVLQFFFEMLEILSLCEPFLSFMFIIKPTLIISKLIQALRGYFTSYPKISMFCVLSQDYQHFFEKKNNVCIF